LTSASFPVVIFLVTAMVLSVWRRKLTLVAALVGGATGWIIFWGGGLSSLLCLTAFFLLGTLATSWKRKEKNSIDREGAGAEKRKTGQVLANAGVAALLALAALFYPGQASLFHLMIAGSFASAAADTLSSELGMVYGRRFYNCLSWKKEDKGPDGVVSWEGTLIGLAGAGLIAGIYVIGGNSGRGRDFLAIILAGALGNFSDSMLGATLEKKGWLGNDGVNFTSTAIAALVTLVVVI